MFNLLHTYLPNPILFTIGQLNIYWYGLLLAAALLAGYCLARFLAKRKNLPISQIESLYINLVIWGFIGARLYHVLNEWRFYWQNPAEVLMVWHGGLAIHGAIIGGLVALYYLARARQLNFWVLADLFALPLLLGQAIGRWGNYFNQELMGYPTTLPWSIPITLARRSAGFEDYAYYHPAFLYESLWDLAAFAFLLWIFLKNKYRPATIFWLYLGLYALGRVGAEFFRIDNVPYIWGIRLPFAVSALSVGASIIMLWRMRRRF